jgi:hypothetical protein
VEVASDELEGTISATKHMRSENKMNRNDSISMGKYNIPRGARKKGSTKVQAVNRRQRCA